MEEILVDALDADVPFDNAHNAHFVVGVKKCH